jgi:hypothetical protein
MKDATQGYPSEFRDYEDVSGYGGVRIYKVTEAQAKKIVEEFPSNFSYTPAFRTTKDDQLFYMNVNHGEQHFIFSLPR